MKIKGLLIGMLACTALVGCTDDDVLNNGNELENQQGEKMRAYMTFSIASSTNSSRGVGEGATDGDKHGNAEHSGHESEGITAENTINDILVVFYNTEGNDGFCDLYSMSTTDNLTYNGYSTKFEEEAASTNGVKTYKLSEPFALNSLGKYKALIVINPADDIKNLTASNATQAKKHYEDIVNTGYADAVTDVTGTEYNNFMMANRTEVTINVTEKNNDPSNPAQYMVGSDENSMQPAYIEVERVASKITFRPTNNNEYSITETTYKYEIDNGSFWYKDPDTGLYNYLSNLFKAQDTTADKNTYWVYVNEDGTTVRYKIDDAFKGSDDDKLGEAEGSEGDGMYEGELSTSGEQTTNKVIAQVVKDVTEEEADKTIVYVGTKITDDPDTKTYTIKLQKYALVNLNNKVYYVRHTSNDPAGTAAPWGIVSASTTAPKYLIEPNTAIKSVNVTSWGNPMKWQFETEANKIYGNDFVTVTDDIALNGTNSSYLKTFETVDHGSASAQVTPSGTGVSATTPDATSVGNLLGYCMENSMLADNQNALTSTSIIFEAQIYDESDKALEYMIEYNGDFFSRFSALVEATKGGDDKPITDSKFWAFTDADYPSNESDRLTWANKLKDLGATLYHDGKCYYFSSQIEHFDNDGGFKDDGTIDEKGKGIMENAIMRNNIYSLAVTNVDGFGFSNLDLASGVLNEESITEQEKVYLTLTAKTLPWIVRFNNIQF